MPSPFVGQSVPRRDAPDKATGRARYVDDLPFPDLLYGATIRSGVASGLLRGIHCDPDFDWGGFTIVTAEDVPGRNRVAMIRDDQPFLAEQFIRHAEEPVLLLAHADRATLREAARHIHLEIEPHPPNFDPEQSTAEFARYEINSGDVAHARADYTLEGVYRTAAVDQLYLEPQGMVARASGRDGVTVWGSMQCPYYVQLALETLFGEIEDRIRVVQSVTGGGFGGKEDYPSILAGHAALLAWKSRRTVKMIYDRGEDLRATTKRHPSRTRIRSGFTRAGELVFLEIDFLLDGGAYCTLSPVVLSRGMLHSTSVYRCSNVRINGRVVATNHPPFGAFRGFGVPQAIFAIERHMDRAARELRLDPAELRRRNLLRPGDLFPCGQPVPADTNLERLLDLALAESGWGTRPGLGLSCSLHGGGFTGSGEQHLASRVAIEVDDAGIVHLLVSSTEIGQGAETVLAQIAADALGIDISRVVLETRDTHLVPDSGPTVASRTSMIVGGLVASAAAALRENLAVGGSRAECGYSKPEGIEWDDLRFRGSPYAGYSWAVDVAAVDVDPLTANISVRSVTAVIEAGAILNPVLAEGQVAGGIAQGAGMALCEETHWDNGRVANDRLSSYIIPTALDAPPVHVIFAESPSGPKGLGELPLNGIAPAILNAVAAATGADPCELPLTPERLLALQEDPCNSTAK